MLSLPKTKTTVGDLLAALDGHAHDTEVRFSNAKAKDPVPCWCGCGGTTKSRFVPGHDSKFHGLAKRVARDQADLGQALAGLAHDTAREHFLAYVAEVRLAETAVEPVVETEPEAETETVAQAA